MLETSMKCDVFAANSAIYQIRTDLTPSIRTANRRAACSPDLTRQLPARALRLRRHGGSPCFAMATDFRTRKLAFSALMVPLICGALGWASAARADDTELSKVRFLLTWGQKGSEPGAFHFPIGIAIDPADDILVTDHYNN